MYEGIGDDQGEILDPKFKPSNKADDENTVEPVSMAGIQALLLTNSSEELLNV